MASKGYTKVSQFVNKQKAKRMKNISVIMLTLLFFVVTNADAQRRNKNLKRPNKTEKKKTTRKIPTGYQRTTKPQKTVHKPVKRVRVNRTRVAHYDYRHLPKRGAVITSINNRALRIQFNGINYRVYAGVWYKPYGNQWLVTHPSSGVRLRTLPVGYRKVLVGRNVYYYYYGTYYRQKNQEYEVVSAPNGAEIGSLPDGYNEITVNGVNYYELDGIYYMPSLDDQGNEILIVVERPAF